MQIRVEHLPGSSLSEDCIFGDGTVTIGRAEGCSLRFDPYTDVKVSGRHAEIRVDSAGVTFTDLGSTNGSHINGTKVSGPQHLNSGDLIQLGSSGPQFRVHITPGPPAQPESEPPTDPWKEVRDDQRSTQPSPPPMPSQHAVMPPPPSPYAPPPTLAPQGTPGVLLNKDRTIIDLPLPQPLGPLVQNWAVANGFKLKSQDQLSSVYGRGGFWTAPIRVAVAQRGRKVHIEAWIAPNIVARMFSLFIVPKEMGIHSGGLIGVLPRKQARKKVNDLLMRLAGPQIT